MRLLNCKEDSVVVMLFLLAATYMPQMAFAGFGTDDNDATASSSNHNGTDKHDRDVNMTEDENTTDFTTFNLGGGK